MSESFVFRLGSSPSLEYTNEDGETVSVQFERVQANVPDSPLASEPVLVPREPDPEILDYPEVMDYLEKQEQKHNISIYPRSAVEIRHKA